MLMMDGADLSGVSEKPEFEALLYQLASRKGQGGQCRCSWTDMMRACTSLSGEDGTSSTARCTADVRQVPGSV
jgi:hypothetical protein